MVEPSEEWVEPPAPRLRPGVRRRAAWRALRLLAGLSLLALLVAFGLDAAGRLEASLALTIGHAIAQVVTSSWVAGTLVGFEGDTRTLVRTTIGLSPMRLFVAAIALVGAALGGDLEQGPLLIGFMGTYVLGHVVEAVLLSDLAAGVEASK